ncbi:MAG: thioredoxin domain-containing protein [Candidatus Andersenbacteria bacterium]
MDTPNPPVEPRPTVSNIGVPAAIVMAGGLIALAIYFGGGPATSPATNDPSVAGTVASPPPPAPVEPAVGEFRPITAADHTRGPENAKVTVIEYSDLECPFCKRFHPTMQRLLSEYPQDVRWVYRHFPIEQLHSQAKAEAVATECAGEQGKFWELLDKIYEVTPSNDGLKLEELPQLAQEVGVPNQAQFAACLNSTKYDERIQTDISDAQAAGARGTPYSVVVGPSGQKFPVPGALPYEQVKAVVEQALQS